MNYSTYSQIRDFKQWKEKRCEWWASSDLPKCCLLCGTNKCTLVLHHMSYRRACDEALTDLVPLCPTCHENIHKALRKRHWHYTKTLVLAIETADELDRVLETVRCYEALGCLFAPSESEIEKALFRRRVLTRKPWEKPPKKKRSRRKKRKRRTQSTRR